MSKQKPLFINVDELKPYLPEELSVYVEKCDSNYQPKRKGKNKVGLCPVHDENNASFSVNDDKGVFKCFSCGFGGSGIIDFHQKYYKKDFKESLQELASEYAPHLLPANHPQYTKTAPKKKPAKKKEAPTPKISDKRRIELFTAIFTKFGGSCSKQAVKWLTSPQRGLNSETINKFQLLSIDNLRQYNKVTQHLKQQGFTKDEIKAAGFSTFYIFAGKSIPFVCIPYFQNGEIVYLQARAIANKIKVDGKNKIRTLDRRTFDLPKYLNPSTANIPLFNGDVLKGLKPKSKVFIAEGAFDAMLVSQHGYKAVANTSASNIHALKASLSDFKGLFTIYAGDNDQAGQKRWLDPQNPKESILPLFQEAGQEIYKFPFCYFGGDMTDFLVKNGEREFQKRMSLLGSVIAVKYNGNQLSKSKPKIGVDTTILKAVNQSFISKNELKNSFEKNNQKNERGQERRPKFQKAKILNSQPLNNHAIAVDWLQFHLKAKDPLFLQYHECAEIAEKTLEIDGKEEKKFKHFFTLQDGLFIDFPNTQRTANFLNRGEIWWDGEPFATYTYNPHSLAFEGVEKESVILKLSNVQLYKSDWVERLEFLFNFLSLEVKNVTRLDIAIDTPKRHVVEKSNGIIDFVYNVWRSKGKYRKVGKGQIKFDVKMNHDQLDNFTIGSRTSTKYLKAYNKTKEILTSSHKYYIMDWWKLNGIVDGKNENEIVERVEFTLRNEYLKKFQGKEPEKHKIELAKGKIIELESADNKGLDWRKLNDSNYLASWFRTASKKYFEFVLFDPKKKITHMKKIDLFDWEKLGGELLEKASTLETDKVISVKRSIKVDLRMLVFYGYVPALDNIAFKVEKYRLRQWLSRRWKYIMYEFKKEAALRCIISKDDLQDYNLTERNEELKDAHQRLFNRDYTPLLQCNFGGALLNLLSVEMTERGVELEYGNGVVTTSKLIPPSFDSTIMVESLNKQKSRSWGDSYEEKDTVI